MTELIGRWESKKGRYVVELRKALGSGYYYSGYSSGGCLGNDCTEAQAIAEIERRCQSGAGHFQPDSNKSAMRRTI